MAVPRITPRNPTPYPFLILLDGADVFYKTEMNSNDLTKA